jgi:hypothetical protein
MRDYEKAYELLRKVWQCTGGISDVLDFKLVQEIDKFFEEEEN